MIAPLKPQVIAISQEVDITENDKNDTLLLNEVYSERVDILISEDRKIHTKAKKLGIEDRVFTIDSFLEMVVSEYPELIDYKVLAVKQEYFGNIDLTDPFFDSLKEDYPGFERWFNKKAYYHSVITTIGIVEDKIDDIQSETEFVLKSRKRSIFTDDYLKEFWNYDPRYRPFMIRFLSVYSFPLGNRLNRKSLLELGIISGEENELRGLKKITREQFILLLKETKTNESIVVN